MTTLASVSWWYPVVIWGLLLGGAVRESQRLLGDRGPKWLPLAAVLVMFVPLHGLPAGRWLHGVTATFSIPLAALLVHAVVSPLLRAPLLGKKEEHQVWWLGAILGLSVYPAALGWGTVDPYVFGWRDWGVAAWLALPTALLLWQGTRLGYVLLVTAIAWQVGIVESNNAWDYVVDPLFALMGWVKVSAGLISEGKKGIVGRRSPHDLSLEVVAPPLRKAS
jgi:hypothetical protein